MVVSSELVSRKEEARKRKQGVSLLPSTFYLLATAYYLPQVTTDCLLPTVTTCCLLLAAPTTYNLLPTVFYLLFATYYLLPTTYYLLPTTYHLLSTIYHLRPTTYYRLPTTYQHVPAACYLRHAAYCLVLLTFLFSLPPSSSRPPIYLHPLRLHLPRRLSSQPTPGAVVDSSGDRPYPRTPPGLSGNFSLGWHTQEAERSWMLPPRRFWLICGPRQLPHGNGLVHRLPAEKHFPTYWQAEMSSKLAVGS